jgi:DNA-binding NtrC family response regulator
MERSLPPIVRLEPGPAGPQEGQTRGIFTMVTGNSPPPRVLVVDDEALIRWSLSESLTRAGYHVIEAPDRRTALEAFEPQRQGVCAVLLDLRLPDSHDLSLLRLIRLRAPQCRIIVMTAHGTPELTQEALKDGAFRVVDKPFDLDDMVGFVAEALQQPLH